MAGYSGTPLIKKLGIKENFLVTLINEPKNYFQLLETLPQNLNITKSKKEIDFIHLFVSNAKEISQLKKLKDEIKKDGTIWVSWEKKKVKEKDAANENLIREKALSLGLVDVKVCAVDELWSGLKLVWRKENR